MSEPSPSVAAVETTLADARRLLGTNPGRAADQAQVVLTQIPGHPLALLILGAARRILGDTRSAIDMLEPLSREQAHAGPVWLELGIALGEASRAKDALVALKRASQLMPQSPDALRYLADQLDLAGESAAADATRARYLSSANRDPALSAAAAALVSNDLPLADARLLAHLKTNPKDVAALRMRAEVAARLRLYRDAERLLEQCLALAPSFDAARHRGHRTRHGC